MLKAIDVTKTFPMPGIKGKRMFEAVSNVSFEIAEERVCAFVGESGSGKSTLARMLSYVEKPTSGAVYLDETMVSGRSRGVLRPLRGVVQLVMQDAESSLDPRQTVSAILDEPLKLLCALPADVREARKRELLDMVKLPGDFLRKRPGEMSGGQQKRVCIARALATQPKYILFDESFGGLDVTLRKQILDLLRELKQKLKISYLIITHDLDTAMYMADVVHVMKDGQIIETVDSPKVFADFKSPYANELVKALLSKRQALHTIQTEGE